MNTKKLVTYVLVAFVIFYLFSQPSDAAAAVRSLMSGIGRGANQLAAFFNSLFAG